jgi:hypothetical protein
VNLVSLDFGALTNFEPKKEEMRKKGSESGK